MEFTAYLGMYTQGAGRGIYAARFDARSGDLSEIELAAECSNPSFLAVHPAQPYLYAVNEDDHGSVSAFEIDTSRRGLKLLNTVSTRGSAPCHVSLDRDGNWLFVANYKSGSSAVFSVRGDGSLGEASDFVQHAGCSIHPEQQGPHAHEVVITADNCSVLIPDLGADRVFLHRFDAGRGKLAPDTPPFIKAEPGSGPRHLVFHPDGRLLYVLNELAATIVTYARNALWKELQTASTLPEDFHGVRSAAEIVIHPSGKFLYASNRVHDSIAIFRILADTGALAAMGYVSTCGHKPRYITLDPTASWLLAANQDSGTIAVFRIDPDSGRLTAAGMTGLPSPACIVFVPPE